MLTAVLVLFSVGAVINALAPTIEVLIAGRVLQGVAGGVFPLAFGIVRDTFPRDQVAGGLAIVIGDLRHRRRDRAAAVGRDRRQRRSRVAVLDQPDRGAGGVRRAPAHPAVAAGREHAGRLARRRRCCPGALAAILLGVSQAGEWGWGSPANVGCDRRRLVLVGVFVWPSRRA